MAQRGSRMSAGSLTMLPAATPSTCALSRSPVDGCRRPVRISNRFGDRSVWPGDTFGISMLPRPRSVDGEQRGGLLVVSWGSAVGDQRHPKSVIFAAVVSIR